VDEPEVRKVMMKEGKQVDAAGLLPAPVSRCGRDGPDVTRKNLTQVVPHLDPELLRDVAVTKWRETVDPTVRIGAEVDRVERVV
jgi:hypothetical protein